MGHAGYLAVAGELSAVLSWLLPRPRRAYHLAKGGRGSRNCVGGFGVGCPLIGCASQVKEFVFNFNNRAVSITLNPHAEELVEDLMQFSWIAALELQCTFSLPLRISRWPAVMCCHHAVPCVYSEGHFSCRAHFQDDLLQEFLLPSGC